MTTDSWAVLGAVATTASAIVIAYQSIQTKKSVGAAKQGAEAAAAAVGISQAILQETQLARIDSAIPRLLVIAEPQNPRVDRLTGRNTEQIWPEASFQLPRDANHCIAATVSFSVHSDGPGMADLHAYNDEAFSVAGVSRTRYALLPGNDISVSYQISHTVAKWVELAQAPTNGESAKPHIFGLWHRGPNDAEATESIEIHTSGTVLQEVPDSAGSWQLIPNLLLAPEVQPTIRRYWLSVSANIQFPSFDKRSEHSAPSLGD
ncbi:hypothetical protein [Frigoribacterium sp. CG_9.8]|uniref:hypothetical protein n=1 Tax=Frigoribacterium sp. CG_9.8 TaxID=2787733 RepID=UPI0018CA9E97|nr:hypothetical protein [Frigoribacterium sp. CG_9.8]MBG6108040.1 hypothetical protein [Frigoribacterium sp. CG_9.8]